MATPKMHNCNILVALVLLLMPGVCWAQEVSAGQILIDSYEASAVNCENRPATIARLKAALDEAADAYLSRRVIYRIGMLYLAENSHATALDYFEKASQHSGSPDEITLCALNMKGQVNTMLGDVESALDSFEELIAASEHLPGHADSSELALINRLKPNAHISKAQIYHFLGNYNAALNEYERVLDNFRNLDNDYAATALDRMAQIHLIIGDTESYFETADQFLLEHPRHYRTPLIHFEREAVSVLVDYDSQPDFPLGSFDVAVKTLQLIKDNDDPELHGRIEAKLMEIINQFPDTFGSNILSYHYAWLCDLADRPDTAIEVLAGIDSDAATAHNAVVADAADILDKYAKLYRALLIGEKQEYREALAIVNSVEAAPAQTHLQILKDSLHNNLQVLRREVRQ